MTEPGIKLTTYFGEREREHGRFLADALFDAYERHQMRTSVLLRGVEGFGERHRFHTGRLLTLSESLPVVSIAVDTRDRIEGALEDVLALSGNGLTTLERAQLATGPDLDRLQLPGAHKGALKLTVYGGRRVRSGGDAGYVAAVELLRESGATGASVLLGVDGTLHGDRRRARFFARNADVPLMLVAIGMPAALGAALPGVARLLDEPVATIERVQVCKSSGRLLEEPRAVSERDRSGLPILQKLIVRVEEGAGQARRAPGSHPARPAPARGGRGGSHGAAGRARVLRRTRAVRGPRTFDPTQRAGRGSRDRHARRRAPLVAGH